MTVSIPEGGYEQGVIMSVTEAPAGDSLIAPGAIGDTLLTINDATDFSEAGGQVEINGHVYTYLTKTDEPSTLLLAPGSGLIEAFNLIEYSPRVNLSPTVYEKMAQVLIQGNDDAVTARVPSSLYAQIPDGIRDEVDRETVNIQMQNNEFVILDVVNKEPLLDGVYIDPGSLPTGPVSDGEVPPDVTGVIAAGTVRAVALSWPAVTNFDVTWYRIYGSKTSGFAIDDAKNYIGEAHSNLFFAQQAYDPATNSLINVAPDNGPFYWRVLAVDEDGNAVNASPEVQGTPIQVTSPDIATNAVVAASILAGAITADKFAAVLVLASKLLVGSRITESDIDGIQIRTDSGVISFPADGTAATIYSDLIAFSLEVRDSLNIRGLNNYLAGTLTAAASVVDPKSAPTGSGFWPSVSTVNAPNFARNWAMAPASPTTTGYVAGALYGLVKDYDVATHTILSTSVWRFNPDGTETFIKKLYDNAGNPSGTYDTPANWFTGCFVHLSDGAGGYNYHLLQYKNTATAGVYTYRVQVYDKNFNLLNTYTVTAPGISAWDIPALGRDGAAPILAWRRASDSKLCVQTYTAVYATNGALVVSAVALNPSPVEFIDQFVPGGKESNIIFEADTWMRFNAATNPARVSGNDIGHAPSYMPGVGNVYTPSDQPGMGYVEKDGNGTLWYYSWSTAKVTYKCKYTWYDGDPLGSFGAGGETKASNVGSFLCPAGVFPRFDFPAPPDGGDPDDPDRVRVYANNDGTSVYKLQGALAVGQLSTYFTSIVAGADSPPTSGFASRPGAIGTFQSAKTDGAGALWSLAGNGPGRLGSIKTDVNGARTDKPSAMYYNPNIPGSASSTFPAAATNVRWLSQNSGNDPAGNFSQPSNGTGGDGRIQVAQAGLYRFTVKFTFASNSTGTQRQISIKLNGGAIWGWDSCPPQAASGSSLTAVGLVRMAAGDYLITEVNHNATASLGLFGASSGICHFQIERTND